MVAICQLDHFALSLGIGAGARVCQSSAKRIQKIPKDDSWKSTVFHIPNLHGTELLWAVGSDPIRKALWFASTPRWPLQTLCMCMSKCRPLRIHEDKMLWTPLDAEKLLLHNDVLSASSPQKSRQAPDSEFQSLTQLQFVGWNLFSTLSRSTRAPGNSKVLLPAQTQSAVWNLAVAHD